MKLIVLIGSIGLRGGNVGECETIRHNRPAWMISLFYNVTHVSSTRLVQRRSNKKEPPPTTWRTVNVTDKIPTILSLSRQSNLRIIATDLKFIPLAIRTGVRHMKGCHSKSECPIARVPKKYAPKRVNWIHIDFPRLLSPFHLFLPFYSSLIFDDPSLVSRCYRPLYYNVVGTVIAVTLA